MKRRAPRPTALHMAQMATLACYPRDECPDPERFAALLAMLSAWEEEEKRLKDPVGHLVRRLEAEQLGVTFSDASKPGLPLVRLGLYREARLRYEPSEPLAPLVGAYLTAIAPLNLRIKTVLAPQVDLAENVELPRWLLTDDEWDHEDEICAELRRRAGVLVQAAGKAE